MVAQSQASAHGLTDAQSFIIERYCFRNITYSSSALDHERSYVRLTKQIRCCQPRRAGTHNDDGDEFILHDGYLRTSFRPIVTIDLRMGKDCSASGPLRNLIDIEPGGVCVSFMNCLLEFERDKPAACEHKAEQRSQVKVDFSCPSRLL